MALMGYQVGSLDPQLYAAANNSNRWMDDVSAAMNGALRGMATGMSLAKMKQELVIGAAQVDKANADLKALQDSALLANENTMNMIMSQQGMSNLGWAPSATSTGMIASGGTPPVPSTPPSLAEDPLKKAISVGTYVPGQSQKDNNIFAIPAPVPATGI